jgi:hypothetical protein
MPLHMMVSVHIQEFVSSSRTGQIGGLRTTIRYAPGGGMGKRLSLSQMFSSLMRGIYKTFVSSVCFNFHVFCLRYARSLKVLWPLVLG